MLPDEIRSHVRDYYAQRASRGGCCEGSELAAACCVGPTEAETMEYFEGPSLGCGSPLEHAAVQLGETVVDLGSGAGREVLLAAGQTGTAGRAVGIDMTPEMVWKARENAQRIGVPNAEFRLGEIEHLPLPDESADVVISNCVINLMPDKAAAFREAFRVLRRGGRLVISDMVSSGPVPASVRADPAAWDACIAGALDLSDYLALMKAAGFEHIETLTSTPRLLGRVFSATVRGVKPPA